MEETEAFHIRVSYVYLSDMKWDIIVQPFRKKCVKMIKASFCVFPPSLLAFALLAPLDASFELPFTCSLDCMPCLLALHHNRVRNVRSRRKEEHHRLMNLGSRTQKTRTLHQVSICPYYRLPRSVTRTSVIAFPPPNVPGAPSVDG